MPVEERQRLLWNLFPRITQAQSMDVLLAGFTGGLQGRAVGCRSVASHVPDDDDRCRHGLLRVACSILGS